MARADLVTEARALRAQGRLAEAVQACAQAAQLEPGGLDAPMLAGQILQQAGQYDAAAAWYERAVQAAPQSAEARFLLGNMYRMQGRTEEAIGCYDTALEWDPRLAEAFANRARILPIVYRDMAEIDEYRARYSAGLNDLEQRADLATAPGRKFALKGILASTNFFLQYQGRDDRVLQARYGEHVCRVMAACFPQWAKAIPVAPPAAGERIRIGYCSAFLRDHNGAVWLLGWLRHRDRARFEVYCYQTKARTDAKSEEFRRLSDQFVHVPGGIEEACTRIRADNLHVLVYPELGMDAQSLAMAGLRLAPVQGVGWGHPITSGLPTMDFWLSCDLMEPANGQDHYTEKLVRLPNVGHVRVRAQRDRILATPPPKTCADFGLPPDAVIYLATQSLFKYLPAHDRLFSAIAKRVARARFVFVGISSVEVVRRFMARIEAAFATEGLRAAEHCIMLPRQSDADYVNLNRVADVFLDNPAWSGNNTTLTALECELPVVTLPTDFMRGRHSYGILRMLGLTDAIARDADDYVEIAVRLGTDAALRAQARAAIRERIDGLYEDVSCAQALDAFYEEATAAQSGFRRTT